MPRTNPYTFNDWMEGESGEVKEIPKEGYPFQSQYVTEYNYLRERNWEHQKGGTWLCPHTGYIMKRKEALTSQRLIDIREGIN